MKALIKRADTHGIPGGWAIRFTYKGEQRIFSGSPKTIPSAIHAWLSVNKSGISIEQVWRECNRQWLLRTPRSRWDQGAEELIQDYESPPETDTLAPISRSTEHWGPSVWGFLHHFGALETFNTATKGAWDAITGILIPQWLDPEQNPSTGCSEAVEGWRAWIAKNPPGNVGNPKAAAEWTFKAHSEVRRAQGKVLLTFAQAGRIHGWDC